jgi:hypothetical protein
LLTLGDGAFSLSLAYSLSCPGFGTEVDLVAVGGALRASGGHLELRAIDPSSPSSTTMTAAATVTGDAAAVTFPGGAWLFDSPATLAFGRQATP